MSLITYCYVDLHSVVFHEQLHRNTIVIEGNICKTSSCLLDIIYHLELLRVKYNIYLAASATALSEV